MSIDPGAGLSLAEWIMSAFGALGSAIFGLAIRGLNMRFEGIEKAQTEAQTERQQIFSKFEQMERAHNASNITHITALNGLARQMPTEQLIRLAMGDALGPVRERLARIETSLNLATHGQ